MRRRQYASPNVKGLIDKLYRLIHVRALGKFFKAHKPSVDDDIEKTIAKLLLEGIHPGLVHYEVGEAEASGRRLVEGLRPPKGKS